MKRLLSNVFFLTFFISSSAYAKDLSGHEIWQSLFVPAVHKRFLTEVPTTQRFEDLVRSEGGTIVLDHGATRTPDPKVHNFITRLTRAFGLSKNGNYEFPEKKLTAIDLQFTDTNGFKWFSTLIKYNELSPEAAKAIEDDIAQTKNQISSKGEKLLRKLEKKKTLTENEAKLLVSEVVNKFMHRQGAPLKESTVKLLQKESPETLNALLLGPDFNHIAYSLNDINIPHWYGQEIIEVLEARMQQEGFAMIPKIQGPRGGILRQTSTIADNKEFPLAIKDGRSKKQIHPNKFIEVIQRGIEHNQEGRMLVGNKNVKLFRGFLRNNADKIYESTGTKA